MPPPIDPAVAAATIRMSGATQAEMDTARFQNQLTVIDESNREQALEQINEKLAAGKELGPEETRFLEQERERLNPQQPAAAPAAPTTATTTVPEVPGELTSDLADALVAKLQKGEDLTAEERAVAEKILAVEKPTVKTFAIAGQQYTVDQLTPDVVKHYGITPDDFAGMKPETRERMVENYITTTRKEDWTAGNQRRSQELARSRRQIGEITLNLMNANDKLREDLQAAQSALNEAKALAEEKIDPASVRDEQGVIDPIKLRRFNKVLDAQEAIPRLTHQIQTLTERSAQTEKELAVATLRDFQEAHPQYRTSMDIAQAHELLRQGVLNTEDTDKVMDIMEIHQTAFELKLPVEVVYQRLVKQPGKLMVRNTDGTNGQRTSPATFRLTERQEGADRDRLIQALREKRELLSPGRAAMRGATVQKTGQRLAVETIRAGADRQAQSGALTQESKLSLDEMGY